MSEFCGSDGWLARAESVVDYGPIYWLDSRVEERVPELSRPVPEFEDGDLAGASPTPALEERWLPNQVLQLDPPI